MIQRLDLVQEPLKETAEWTSVREIAHAVEAYLRAPEIMAQVASINQPGTSSARVQDVLLARALELGFRDESEGLFRTYSSALRPDYYLPLPGTGIILEVERGKTTINNMDLLDFWKCHICEHAHYLFLMVPLELRQNPTMAPRREYATVSRRLTTFFYPQNYTNVRGVVLFGY